MELDALKGGAEGAANVLEMQRMAQTENRMGPQDQNRLAHREQQGEGAARPQSGVAIQGLGENLNLMV
ncbi:hypothetical protein LN040_00680 [Desulfovibrio subterraneus]|jgi:hypothetical protein|uniref:Uncharacterized protein n=1 Tax=Desulfovibrio subterraneus TaxID=2718620 RepID=A0A7J0BJU5_9BACT|nr:hypothetical protein [Desulfovibrio subterraneus]WBF67659.1 hypothetical protein LN040_00680 [Desulfovibrio subterraneus]GFM33491.1 hypothetical protein DSM101010T_18560 [Desulfovibrio subterraneus]